MKQAICCWLIILVNFWPGAVPPLNGASTADPGLQHYEFTVSGLPREALIHVPANAKVQRTPVVFVFHGHGGNMRQAARSFGIERLWPEAICVYMQGLPTPGVITDPKGEKNGWQMRTGLQGDRDLAFFDSVHAMLKREYVVDEKRIYSTGHSNGGGFTYLLWAERGGLFAAMAPSAAVFTQVRQLKPKPVLHLAGEQDQLVKYSWQKKMIEAERRLNNCQTEGVPWAENCTLYPSKEGTPVVACIFHGGHEFRPAASALIVRFFKEHPAESR